MNKDQLRKMQNKRQLSKYLAKRISEQGVSFNNANLIYDFLIEFEDETES